MDYMGACCRIRLIAPEILPTVDAVAIMDGGDQADPATQPTAVGMRGRWLNRVPD